MVLGKAGEEGIVFGKGWFLKSFFFFFCVCVCVCVISLTFIICIDY